MPAANLKKNPKAASQTFILDCSKPVDDGLMDAASFVRVPNRIFFRRHSQLPKNSHNVSRVYS